MLLKTLKKHNKTIKNWFIYLILACIIVNIIATPMQMEKINRFASYLCLVSVLLCFLYCVFIEETTIQGLLMLVFACITVAFLLITKSISYDNIVSVAIFLELPILFFCYDTDERKGMIGKISFVFLFATVFYFSYCFFDSSYGYDITGYFFHSAFTLGYYNPNQLGLRLVQCFLVLLCATVYYDKLFIRIIYGIATLVSIYLILITDSRTCFVVILFSVILFAIQGKIKVKPIFVLFAVLVPIFVALFLLKGEAIYKNWTFLGEMFDYGRKGEYEIVFKDVSFLSAIFGNVGYHRFDNNHNALLTIFANLGILGMSIFFGIMMHKVLKIVNGTMTKYQNTAVIGVLALIIQSSMESTVFTAGSYISIPFFLLFLIASTTEKKALNGFEKRAHKLF